MSSFDARPDFFPVLSSMDNSLDRGLNALPLNLLAHLISYIDNVGDLARLCRTTRRLHYMTVPQLYKNIILTSYPDIRFNDQDVPEGFGSASPFTMGLNALVTRKLSNLVQTLDLRGHWPENDLEDYARVGRVPDSSMMLNIVVRAALDRCTSLETFKWNLNIRTAPTVYAGISQLKCLRRLDLKFSSSRIPQPGTVVPPLPNLKMFVFMDYDPLNFPPDVSELMFHATKMEELHMHFSPRMRQCGEASLQLYTLFKRNVVENRTIYLKRCGLYNCFALMTPEVGRIFDPVVVEEVTAINTHGTGFLDDDGPVTNYFIDKSWKNPDHEGTHKNLRMIRGNNIHPRSIEDLASMYDLERVYWVVSRRGKDLRNFDSTSRHPSSEVSTPSTNTKTPPSTTSSTISRAPSLARIAVNTETLRDSLISVLSIHHGHSLRHVIFPPRLPLSTCSLAELIRGCPNVTQLAFALEEIEPDVLKHILPFAKNLRAVRVLMPEQPGEEGLERARRFAAFECRPDHHARMEIELATMYGKSLPESYRLKYVGLGDHVFEIGKLNDECVTEIDEEGNVVENRVRKRSLRSLTLEDVSEVEIWKYASPDMII